MSPAPQLPCPTPLQAVQARIRQIQQIAAGRNLRPPPTEPVTCCGRGCNGCVWESYYNAVDYWCDEAMLKLAADPDLAGPP